MRTVVVGMSGGVDSSVSALLLKQAGYRVIGLYMDNWQAEGGACSTHQDYDDVAQTCSQLDIPFSSLSFAEAYQERVFSRLLAGYARGATPNPDTLCNQEIKFRLFFDKALSLGADAMATGHYCQVSAGRLLKGRDPSKDQSYFLYGIDPKVLDRVMFPVGGLLKSEVREIARQNGLPTSGKKDSTGLCFIGEQPFREFLAQYLRYEAGPFRTLSGEVVGEHVGAAFYTVGQRRRLGLGGPGEPWYVVDKDMAANTVFVERGEHPALFADGLIAGEVHWLEPVSLPLQCHAKVRYRQVDQECTVEALPDGRVHVTFARPQRAICAQQAVVFYVGERCLGGAIIDAATPSYWQQDKALPQ